MPQHYQLLKPRLNLRPSTTAHVDYAKCLLGILVLSCFSESPVESILVHVVFFLKNGGKFLKEHLGFLHSWIYNAHRKIM